MSSFLFKRYGLALAAGLIGLPVLAQMQQAPAPNPGLPPAITMPPGQMPAAPMPPMRTGPTDNQLADEANARVALLKASLRLTPEQEPKWGAVESTLRTIMVTRMKARVAAEAERQAERMMHRERWRERHTWSDMQNPPSQAPAMPPQAEAQRPGEMARMRAEADRLAQRANELRSLADAAEPLYALLDQRQRGTLVSFFERGFGGGRR